MIFLVENCPKIRSNRVLQVAGFVALFNGANYLSEALSDASFFREILHFLLQRFAV